MPIFTYRCTNCGRIEDELQGMNEKPLKKCPSCKKPTYKKTFSGMANAHYKGRGFHKTDYEGSNHTKQGNPLLTARDRNPQTGEVMREAYT